MFFLIVIAGLCIWRCTKRGAQFPDMFLGMCLATALTAFVNLSGIGTTIDGAFVDAGSGVVNRVQEWL